MKSSIMKKRFLLSTLLFLLLLIAAILFTSNNHKTPDEYKNEIETIFSAWLSGDLSYSDTVSQLENLETSKHPEVSALASLKLDLVVLEENGNNYLNEANAHLTAKEYAAVFEALNRIDHKYTQYQAAEALYQDCEDAVLDYVSKPDTIDDFYAFLATLSNCLASYNSPNLDSRKKQLADELEIFIEVSNIIQAAVDLYDSAQYEESFVTLALGIEAYPTNSRLSNSLVDFHDHYIISVTKDALALCEKKEYKDAQKLVEQAIEEYNCDEFQLMLTSIKEQKSFIFRFKNNLVEYFTTAAQGWQQEKFDVKQAAASTGAYIVKSGEKLLLGDYSEESVTVLSFSGNLVAALANVDVLLDLRDVVYDVTHWGETEYFLVYLAADVVALLPVIGVIKYLDHFKPIADSINSADLVDSVADIGKKVGDATDVAGSVKDVAKTGNNIIEAVETAKDATRVGEAAKDIATDISKAYRLVPTINSKYLGCKHPDTGIEFVLKKLKYSDGQMIQGVFPVFSSAADINLPKDLYKAKFKDQQDYCLEQLQRKTKPIIGQYRNNFTPNQLAEIADGILPDGFTWHHNEKEGLMQLVDTATHTATHHTGGMSLWGAGY